MNITSKLLLKTHAFFVNQNNNTHEHYFRSKTFYKSIQRELKYLLSLYTLNSKRKHVLNTQNCINKQKKR